MFAGIRAATVDEGDELQKIELSAGERFREVGMPDIADDEPPSAEALSDYATSGRSWVAVDAEIGPQLRSVCDEETAHGLDPAARTCMRLDLSG